MKHILQYGRPTVYWISIGAIGFLFAATGMDKMLNRSLFEFQLSLAPLQIVRNAAPVLSWTLPVAHLLLVAFLFIERLRVAGLYLIILLIACYSLYIGGLLLSSAPLPCSCAGIKSGISWSAQFKVNIALLAILAGVIYLEKTKDNRQKNFAYA